MARILAFISPATGHVLPVAPGLRELARRGHDVTLAADEASLALVGELGLDTVPHDPRIAAIRADDYLAEKPLDRLSRGVECLMERGDLEREHLQRLVGRLDPDVLVIDFNAFGASTYAAASGIPWVHTFPTLVPLPERGIPPFGLGLKPMAGPIGRARDAMFERITMGAYDKAMLPGLNRLRSAVDLPPVGSVVDHLGTADLFLAMSGAPLEYPRTDPPAWLRFVGTEPWDPAHEAPAWLDEPGDPWVLVTCSTEYQGDELLARTAIEALAGEPVRVLVTVADAEGAALPTAPNVRVERFVPHSAVLPRAAAVITHGGMGITQKALHAGVPLVVVPFGRDQPEVARRVSECGAGVRLPLKRLRADRLRQATRRAMQMRSQVEAAGRRLRASGGAGAFADAVEEVVPTTAARISEAVRRTIAV